MEIECKEVEYCKVQVHYEGDSEVVVEKQKEAIDSIKNVQIPGFRKGKAPLDVLKAKFKKNIDEWVKREMLSVAYDDIVFETKMKPIGYPQCISHTLQGSNFVCDLLFMKRPEFELKDYKGLEIPKPHQPQKSSELAEAMMQELRVNFGDLQPYEEGDFVEKGDKVTMDIATTIDGETIDDASKEGMLYEIGVQGSFTEIDDNILGMAPGEEREFEIVLPANFGEYGGKKASIKVTLHMGTKKVPCPLDDELAKKAGCDSFEDMKNKIEMTANAKIQSMEQALVAQQVSKRLVASNDFEVPTWLISMEAQQIAARDNAKLEEMPKVTQEEYRNDAIENVKMALILDTIRDVEPEATLTESEAAEMVKRQLAGRTEDPDKVFVEAQKNGQLVGMIANLKNQFTLQWLVNQTKLIE